MFCPKHLKIFFSKSITSSNNDDNNLKRFLKHIRIGHVIYCRDPDKNFISLLLIIGGLFRAMAQMKACNFLDPHQNTLLSFNQKCWVKSAKNLT